MDYFNMESRFLYHKFQLDNSFQESKKYIKNENYAKKQVKL